MKNFRLIVAEWLESHPVMANILGFFLWIFGSVLYILWHLYYMIMGRPE